MSTFEELAAEYSRNGRRKGCPVCGSTNTGAVTVALSSLTDNGRLNKRIGSKTRSLCEIHAADLFLRLVNDLKDES